MPLFPVGTAPPYLVAFFVDTTVRRVQNAAQRNAFQGLLWLDLGGEIPRAARSLLEGANNMHYMPGLTVQCINAECEGRGRWMRADSTAHVIHDGHCPSCGDYLRNV